LRYSCSLFTLSKFSVVQTPAPFALADFHTFSGVYVALSCAGLASFAGYSAPRVHQENGTLTSTLLGCSFLEKFEQGTQTVLQRGVLL